MNDSLLIKWQTLRRLSRSVNGVPALQQIYREALEALQEILDVDRASILLLDRSGTMRFRASRGLSIEYRRAVEGHSPWSAKDKKPDPILVGELTAEAGLGELTEAVLQEGIRALGFFPLLYRSHLLGKFMIYYNTPHVFTDEELAAGCTIAELIASAIGQHRLNRQRRRFLSVSESAKERLTVLAEASARLSESLDYTSTLRTVTQLLVPRLSDWCVVDILGPDGTLEALALTHQDPARVDLARQLRQRYPVDLQADYGIARVLRTAKPELYEVIEDDILRQAAHDEEHYGILKALGLTSAMVVPLIARDRTIGTLTLVSEQPRRLYGAPDLEFASDLARRCAMAIDNSELFQRVREAEQRYSDLVNELDAIVWEIDASTGQFTFVSRKAEQILGYPVEVWVQEQDFWKQILHPEEAHFAVEFRDGAGLERSSYDLEYRVLAQDGRTVWIRDLVQVIRNGQAPTVLRGIMVDITRAKELEEALRESEERQRLAADSAELGTWDLNLDTGVLRWSERTHLIMGVSPATPVNMDRFFSLLHPEDLTTVRRCIDRALDPGGRGDYEVEFRAVRPDGQVIWLAAKGRAFFQGKNGDRRAVRIIGTVRDDTSRKAMEKRLLTMVEELQDADRRKDEFLATISHELRTPVTAIMGWARLLRTRSFRRSKILEIAEIIERNARVQTQVTNDLLDLSSIVMGKLSLNLQRVSLEGVIQSALETVRQSAEEQDLRIEVQLDPKLILIDCDPDRMRQILWNLLSNAIKFTPAGGSIKLRSAGEPKRLVIRVEDSGVGIPPDLLPHIFDRFRQGDSTTRRRFGGLGLGLTVVKHLVELHGGVVEAESQGRDRGSCFTLRFPVRNRSVSQGPA